MSLLSTDGIEDLVSLMVYEVLLLELNPAIALCDPHMGRDDVCVVTPIFCSYQVVLRYNH